jgi:LEA14-like dessication related protein
VDRRRRKHAAWLSCALVLLWTGGCASLVGGREAPRVSVSDVQLLEATLLEQLYAVTLRVQNPSDRPLALRGGSFDLEINGRDFGHGVSDSQVTVPAFGDAKVEVRMVSTLFGMVRLVQGLQDRRGEALTYEISGWLKIDGRLGGVGFREDGELALPQRRGSRAEPGTL